MKLQQSLLDINQREVDFLNGAKPFQNGEEFIDPNHLYSYDLDVFGSDSLFQYINRTSTRAGYLHLAEQLLCRLTKEGIIKNQEAIRELSPLTDFRQKIRALNMIYGDDQAVYEYLVKWSSTNNSLSKVSKILSIAFPVCFLLALIYFAFHPSFSSIRYLIWPLIGNLFVLGINYKNIREELSKIDYVTNVLRQYGKVLHEIEKASFSSFRLVNLQQRVAGGTVPASVSMGKLARLFSRLDTVYNGMVVLLLSCTFSYHLHLLKRLYKWKDQNMEVVLEWIDAIAELEMLSSLANYAFNNPKFIFPQIADETAFTFKDLGHPLIPEDQRVNNDFSLDKDRFVILTGSNMSGKSTFLRSVGVAMLFTSIGASVCASEAHVFPMQILVSMRVSDSLGEQESYFFAEVKRLKRIADHFSEGKALVLLDEILRGTNSDDKRTGTLEMIRRIVREEVLGIIATHDLEICKEVSNHPSVLINQCFEVEIKNDDLYFDYKLRDGVCKNQSATFLMRKNGII